MLERLRWLFGRPGKSASPYADHDPVYGLPRRAVEEWLARNPRLREEYAVQEWLVRNPPLREEYEEAQKRRILALGAGPVERRSEAPMPVRGGPPAPPAALTAAPGGEKR